MWLLERCCLFVLAKGVKDAEQQDQIVKEMAKEKLKFALLHSVW